MRIRDRIAARLGRVVFHVEPLGYRVAGLVGVGGDVGHVELECVPGIVNASDIAVEDLGLDDVAQLSIQASQIEIALEHRRPYIYGSLDVRAVQGIVLDEGNAAEVRSGEIGNLAAGVLRGTNGKLRQHLPVAQMHGPLDVRVNVEAADVAGVEMRFGAIQVCDGRSESPVHGGECRRCGSAPATGQGPVDDVEAKAWQVKYADLWDTHNWGITRSRCTCEAFKTTQRYRREEAVVVMGEGSVALHLRAGRLGQSFIEGQAIDVAGQVFDGAGNASLRVEILAPVGDDICAALVFQSRCGRAEERFLDASIQQRIPADGERIEARSAVAEIPARSESALAPVLCPDGHIHAAIDDPVEGLAEHQSFNAGVLAFGKEKSRLPSCFVQISLNEGQIEERNTPELEEAVVGARLLIHDVDRPRDQLPVGFGKTAGGHRPVHDPVLIFPCLQQDAAGEDERIRGAVDHRLAHAPHAEGAGHVVECRSVVLQVHFAVTCSENDVVETTLHLQMPLSLHRGCGMVVNDFVGVDDVVLVVENHLACKRGSVSNVNLLRGGPMHGNTRLGFRFRLGNGQQLQTRIVWNLGSIG